MLFLNSAKKIIKVLIILQMITHSQSVLSVVLNNSSTCVMLPLDKNTQQALFPHIIRPINFLVFASESSMLPLYKTISINPHSCYQLIDINNSLVLVDEIIVDPIMKLVGIPKEIIAECTSKMLLASEAQLYHPTNNTLIPLISCKMENTPDNSLSIMNALSQGSLRIEKKIAVVITSYNNKDWYKKNLDSLFRQKYTNYRLLYFDDKSPDDTGALVEKYIKEKNQESRTNLIIQREWKSQMANHYYAVHMCDDDEIIVQFDGDDWLYDENVLTTINALYLNNDIWITYGSAIESTGYQPAIPSAEIMKNVIQKNSYRKEGSWPFCMLRTFYAGLFKSIKLQDLLFNGNWDGTSPAPDSAMMYPMLEMAGFHTHLCDKLLYVVNKKNPFSQCQIAPQKQSELDYTIRYKWPEYEPLYELSINRIAQYENKKADLILWADQISQTLYPSLQAIRKYIKNLNSVFVVCDKQNSENEKELLNLKKEFSEYHFIEYNPRTTHFKSLLAHILNNTGDYLIFASNDFILEKNIDISYCIRELERTFAYGFYLHLQQWQDLKALCAPLSEDIIAWQPDYTQQIWPSPNRLGMILYRKKNLELILNNITCDSIILLKELLAHQPMPERVVGLILK